MVIGIAVQHMSIMFYLNLGAAFKVIYFVWIYRNQVLTVSGICFRYHENQANKQAKNNNLNLPIVSCDLY